MDEQIEVEVRDAYLRGWREGVETMIEDHPDERIAVPHKDAMNEGCGEFLAEWNAHSVIAGKVAELERGLREARPYLEPARLREDANARELLIDRCPVREICKRIDAALAPYPERRSE